MNFFDQIATWSVWSQVFSPRRSIPHPHRLEGTPRRKTRAGRGVGKRGMAGHRLRNARDLEEGRGPEHVVGSRTKRRRESRRFWGAFARGEAA